MTTPITITTGEQHGLTTGDIVYVDPMTGMRMKYFRSLWTRIYSFFGTHYVGTITDVSATSFSMGSYRRETFFDRTWYWIKSLFKKKYGN